MSGEIHVEADDNVAEGANNVIEGAGAAVAVVVDRDRELRLLEDILWEVRLIKTEVRDARREGRIRHDNEAAERAQAGKINNFFLSISTMEMYGSFLLNLKHEFFDHHRFLFKCLAIVPLVAFPVLAGWFVQALPSLYRL